MSKFKYFLQKIVACLKSSNIERNSGRSSSYLISVDAKYSSGLIYFIKSIS